jgi:hypothetical protein
MAAIDLGEQWATRHFHPFRSTVTRAETEHCERHCRERKKQRSSDEAIFLCFVIQWGVTGVAILSLS